MNLKTFSLACLAILGTTFAMSSAQAQVWTVSPTSHSCPNNTVGSATATECGTSTVTVTGGGFIRYRGWNFVSGDTNSFMVNFGVQCYADMAIGNGGTWCSLRFQFQPTKGGLNQAVISVNGEGGYSTLVTLTGMATQAPSLGVSASDPIECGTVAMGSSGVCGPLTLTAQNGPVTLSSAPFAFSSSDFSINPGNCTANRVLAFNESCQTGQVSFSPSSEGAHNATLQITSNAAPVTRNVSGNGVQYTYEWSESGFGACTGGSGEWQLGTWMPSTGCGMLEQSRTVTCGVDIDSGTRTQTVFCRRSDDQPVADSFCDAAGAKPPVSENCTPTTAACGAEPESTRVAMVNTECFLSTCTPDAANNKFCVFAPF